MTSTIPSSPGFNYGDAEKLLGAAGSRSVSGWLFRRTGSSHDAPIQALNRKRDISLVFHQDGSVEGGDARAPRFYASREARKLFGSNAGFITARKISARETYYVLYDGRLAGLDTDDGRQPWSTVCIKHSTHCSHATRKLALEHLPLGQWCEECQAEAEEEKTR